MSTKIEYVVDDKAVEFVVHDDGLFDYDYAVMAKEHRFSSQNSDAGTFEISDFEISDKFSGEKAETLVEKLSKCGISNFKVNGRIVE